MRDRSDFRRRGTGLLDQQLWCWGRDVARPGGNLLLDYGLSRHRSPATHPDCSLYTHRSADGVEVWLWGFGVLFFDPDRGGVFVRRYGFDPLFVERLPPRAVYEMDALGPLARPVSAREWATVRDLVRSFAGWVARYEHWVAETVGPAYRVACVSARPKLPAVTGPRMAAAWEQVAKKCHKLCGRDLDSRGPWEQVLLGLRPIPAPRRGRSFPAIPR